MGTSIDVLFERDPEVDSSDLADRLRKVFTTIESSLATIKECAWYSIDMGDWTVVSTPSLGDEPAHIEAWGPYSFHVFLYERVGLLLHPERFCRVHSRDSPVATSLQVVISALVKSLSRGASFACVAGGATSDSATDLAYYQQAEFTKVCERLNGELGEPAEDWAKIGVHRWLLWRGET